MITTELITDTPGFLKLEKVWNDLLRKSDADTIFLSWEWVSTWWEVFGENKELFMPVFRQGDEILGLAPLYKRKRKIIKILPLREIAFLGGGGPVRSDYMDLICRPEFYDQCRQEFLDFLRRDTTWDTANLKDLRENSSLTDADDGGNLKFSEPNEERCYYIEMPNSFEDYLMELDGKMRRNIRNRRRNLDRDFSSVDFRILEDRDRLPDWMETFKSLHTRRMEKKGVGGKFSSDDYDRFHDLISKKFFDQGRLFAADLKLDGKTVACRYNFLYDNKIYDYQTGFDPVYSRNGVMQALISYIIEYAINNEIREFDFLAGEENYKRRFANRERKICNLRIFNSSSRGRIYRLLSNWKRSLFH